MLSIAAPAEYTLRPRARGPSMDSMKRLAWILLAVLCAALVQVPPAEAMLAQPKCCHCCQMPGAGEMPCCAAPSASLPPALAAESSARLDRQAPAACRAITFFRICWVEPAAIRPALPASAAAVRSAGVPLFKAHGRFLI